MRKRLLILVAIAGVFVAGFLLGNRLIPVQGQAKPGAGFAAIPGSVGGQDIFGAYDVVKDWPQNISTLPGNEKWTYGAGQGIFAESPNRVFMLFRGELPNIKRPETRNIPDFGPSLSFPIGRLPWRDATVAAMPGAGGTGQDPDDGPRLWKGDKPPYKEIGIDAKWEHCFTVVDAQRKNRRDLDAVGLHLQAAALCGHQSLRSGKARVGGRRSHARHLRIQP